MALETLKGVTDIGGYNVVVMDDLRAKYPEKFNESGAMDWEWFEKEIRPNHFIYVRNDKNSISFTIQNGPVKDNGVNGCQVDTLIEAAKLIIEGLNKQFPCRENVDTLFYLNKAMECQYNRTKDREIRNVEGHAEE